MYYRASLVLSIVCLIGAAKGQQQCYFGPGQEFRGPAELVPCNPTGSSACCLLGDVCLSGNACYDPVIGNTYQYGCTDVTYTDATCPYKCGFDPTKSPWTAILQCNGVADVSDTWICQGPESCGCEWRGPTYDMLKLEPRSCNAMGNEALVALYAPAQLAPYIALPSTAGGSTGYFSFYTTDGTSTWVSTAVPSYTPSTVTQFTSYSAPTTSRFINENATPDSATYAPASFADGSLPEPATVHDGSTVPPTQISGGPTFPDTASSTSTPTSSTGTGTGSSSTGSTSSPSSTPTQSSSSSGGLSTGAKAGIGVGVAIGALIILALLFALLFMRRRHKQQLQRHSNPPPPFEHITQAAADEKFPFRGDKKDSAGGGAGSYALVEKDANDVPRTPLELPANGPAEVHELESAPAELSAKPSVKGSPRSPRMHLNSIGSAFTEEGIS